MNGLRPRCAEINSGPTQQLRQLGDVDGDALGFVADQGARSIRTRLNLRPNLMK
jgi:hypothetical protein